ncbi:MAG: energy-coupling factor ABC transporter ATP-binding protein [Faecalibacterium sp.]|nr:energy-coupling factor ABC transporter ATP-binding protein [Ruminococcus sp.]MCM1391150.1 energy-coupling factor ABC transporter ATP-binding protein [Ruminococcus sp.]MCM1486238.1 energy-coupling factor ABC transporter ATP-binding protein [Faecalibacterium sp.]
MSCALKLEDVSFAYTEEKHIFENVNFTLDYGEFVLLSGLSGEGKSTLLSIINGVIPFITSGKLKGKVYINGEDVTKQKISKRAELIGTVLQNADEQIVYDKVCDEIAFGCENFNIPQDEIENRIKFSTELMQLSPDAATKTLSGGQKQRLVTASTLAMKQKIIILDEPLANLDKQGANMLLSTLKNLSADGYAILIVEHRLDMVLPFVSRVCSIENKQIKTNEEKSSFIDTIKIIEHESLSNDISEEPIISGRNLTFCPSVRNILDGLDIDIYRGDRIVLLGENGCGKTTLMRVLARLNKLSDGELTQTILPKDKRKKPTSKWFEKVGFVYQNPSYQLFMPTLLDEVAYRASSKEKAKELISELGLDGLEERHPQSLSEGQKRRASIAAICAGEPDVIFLDEPTVGQDYDNLVRIVRTINKMHRENGTTIITVTHDIRCAEALCDRVFIMDKGKLAKQGDHTLAGEYLKGNIDIINGGKTDVKAYSKN